MPVGDPQRTWFPEMIGYLRLHWDTQLPMPKIIGLRQELDGMLRTIRTTRNINTPVFTCPKCGLRAHGAEPRVTIRALILALGLFEMISQAGVKVLETVSRRQSIEHDG